MAKYHRFTNHECNSIIFLPLWTYIMLVFPRVFFQLLASIALPAAFILFPLPGIIYSFFSQLLTLFTATPFYIVTTPQPQISAQLSLSSGKPVLPPLQLKIGHSLMCSHQSLYFPLVSFVNIYLRHYLANVLSLVDCKLYEGKDHICLCTPLYLQHLAPVSRSSVSYFGRQNIEIIKKKKIKASV